MKLNLSRQAIGWIQGIVTVFIFLGINQIVSRYSSVVLHVNPVVFSCCAFASCALVLIAIGGSGQLVKETIRSIDTWIYGIVLMLSYIIGLILYAYVTSTELTMLQKVSVALTLFSSWLFLARTPDKYQLLGTLIVTAGVVMVAYDIDSENKGFVFFLSFLYGLVQVARVFVAELHRPHAKAASMTTDPKAKARVIGFVMLVVSVIFLSGSLLVSLAQHADGQVTLKGLPTLNDFQHTPTVLAGLLSGILLMAPLRMLEFSSSQIIKAENFMTLLTFMTISTLFWEWSTQGITGMDIKTFSGLDLLAVVLITAGGLIISLTRKLKKKDPFAEYLKVAPQNISEVEETRSYIIGALENFDNNIEKSAKSLGLKTEVMQAIMADKKHILTLKDDLLKQVAKNYRKNIAEGDYLTGLLNKPGFHIAFRQAITETEQLAMFFIDLNKFKPVNDTYGHDAGDFVLAQTGKHLKELFKENTYLTRYGGDEFCILVKDLIKTDAKKMIAKITQTLEQDIKWQKHTINISGSIGLACYPEDTNKPQELIKLADSQMYVQKSER